MSVLLTPPLPPITAPPSLYINLPISLSNINNIKYLTRRSARHLHRNRVGLSPIIRTPLSCCVMDTHPPPQVQDGLLYCGAYWVNKSTIAWNANIGDCSCYLFASKTASLSITEDGVIGYDEKFKLEVDNNGLPENVMKKFPHIRGYRAFKVPPTLDVKSILKCQLAVAAYDRIDWKIKTATGLQLPGVLDDLFSYSGPLGAVFSKESISLNLWAPTAQVVRVCIYKNGSALYPMETIQLEEFDGVWSAKGPRSWEGFYYIYEVSVYHPSTLKIENCIANDPYARGLSADGSRTLFVDLDSDALKPKEWDNLADHKPALLSPSDVSIYELHVRDFRIQCAFVIYGDYLRPESLICIFYQPFNLPVLLTRRINGRMQTQDSCNYGCNHRNCR